MRLPGRIKWHFGTAILAAGLFSGCGQEAPPPETDGGKQDAGERAPQAPDPGSSSGAVADPSAVDAFNPDVTDAQRANPAPRRGGRVLNRTPSDFKTFNIITALTQPDVEIITTLSDSLADRDLATLEFYPEMARHYQIADQVKALGDDPIIGRVLENNETGVVLAPGAFLKTYLLSDAAEIKAEEGYVVLQEALGGGRVHGDVTVGEYTVQIDEGQDPNRERVTISRADLDSYEQQFGAQTRVREFVKPGTIVEFFLRDDVTWSDGQPFTADDVIFSFETIMNPHVDATGQRPSFEIVERVEKMDGGLRFVAKQPYFKFFDAVSSSTGNNFIVPRHVFDPEAYGGDEKAFAEAFNTHPFALNPIYTGPYRVKEYRSGDRLVLERNPTYWKNQIPAEDLPRWEEGQPYLDEIAFVLYTDSGAVVKDLANARLDTDTNVEPIVWNQPDTNTEAFLQRMVRVEDLAQAYTYIGWNMQRPLFEDPQVRRALAMMIPRAEIAQNVHMGAAVPVDGPIFPRSPAYNDDVDPIPYDPAGARRLLARAGWLDRDGDGILEKDIDGQTIPLEFTYSIHNARDYHQKIADIIKQKMEEAGAIVTISKNEWTTFSEIVRDKNFDAVRYAWGAPMDPDLFPIFHSSQSMTGGNNFISYSSERADELTEAIRETLDPEVRWALGRELHAHLAQEQPQAYMFAFKQLAFINRDLRGVRLYPFTYPWNFSEWYWSDIPENRQ